MKVHILVLAVLTSSFFAVLAQSVAAKTPVVAVQVVAVTTVRWRSTVTADTTVWVIAVSTGRWLAELRCELMRGRNDSRY